VGLKASLRGHTLTTVRNTLHDGPHSSGIALFPHDHPEHEEIPMARRLPRNPATATNEQLQAYYRQTARYEGRSPEGFEPTVLEQRSPMDMGACAWDGYLREAFTVCPPEVWDLTTNREGL
jgi:hypothetical protein